MELLLAVTTSSVGDEHGMTLEFYHSIERPYVPQIGMHFDVAIGPHWESFVVSTNLQSFSIY